MSKSIRDDFFKEEYLDLYITLEVLGLGFLFGLSSNSGIKLRTVVTLVIMAFIGLWWLVHERAKIRYEIFKKSKFQ